MWLTLWIKATLPINFPTKFCWTVNNIVLEQIQNPVNIQFGNCYGSKRTQFGDVVLISWIKHQRSEPLFYWKGLPNFNSEYFS